MKQRAQALLWAARELEETGATVAAQAVYAELALLHQELAEERSRAEDSGAWIDVFAAITCLGKAGEPERARSLLGTWREKAVAGGVEEIVQELDSLGRWLSGTAAPGSNPRRTEERTWASLPERFVLAQVSRELSAA